MPGNPKTSILISEDFLPNLHLDVLSVTECKQNHFVLALINVDAFLCKSSWISTPASVTADPPDRNAVPAIPGWASYFLCHSCLNAESEDRALWHRDFRRPSCALPPKELLLRIPGASESYLYPEVLELDSNFRQSIFFHPWRKRNGKWRVEGKESNF